MPRIHITGASGAGTSTLGAALAAHLDHTHIDTDTIYWLPTEPPFTTPRAVDARLIMLRDLLPLDGQWVLSGSARGWTASIEPFYDIIVLLQIDPALRMERVRRREAERYGTRIAPGGYMETASKKFIEWATAYDTAGLEQRSRALHESWLKTQTAPVLRLDSSVPVEELTQKVLAALADKPAR